MRAKRDYLGNRDATSKKPTVILDRERQRYGGAGDVDLSVCLRKVPKRTSTKQPADSTASRLARDAPSGFAAASSYWT